MIGVPVTPLCCFGKRIRLQDVTEREKHNFGAIFSRFFEESPARQQDHEDNAQWTQARGLRLPTSNEEPYVFRRFSGGTTLPRDRYFSLCESEVGDDNNTLLAELLHYTSPEYFKRTMAFDASVQATSEHCGNFVRDYFEEDHPRPNRIYVVIRPKTIVSTRTQGGIEEFFEHWNRSRASKVSFPYAVESLRVANVIDLRLPRTQKWFYGNIVSGIEGLGYVYRDTVVRAGLLVDLLQSLWKRRKFVRKYPKMLINAPYPRSVSLLDIDYPLNFYGLLPYILFRNSGGTSLTEALGGWLRELAVDGLVYPSSRNDVWCKVIEGKVEAYSGWCYVDYRGVNRPREVDRLIREPQTFSDPEVIPRLRMARGRSRYWGSFYVTGGWEAMVKDKLAEAERFSH
jgi:hypothetical protein